MVHEVKDTAELVKKRRTEIKRDERAREKEMHVSCASLQSISQICVIFNGKPHHSVNSPDDSCLFFPLSHLHFPLSYSANASALVSWSIGFDRFGLFVVKCFLKKTHKNCTWLLGSQARFYGLVAQIFTPNCNIFKTCAW